MQRLNALRVDATRTSTVNSAIATSARDDRITVMRTRAVLAALSHERADLLQQLVSHMGAKAFAQTLAPMPARTQTTALRMLSPEKRAVIFRDLTPSQREIWHKACHLEMRAQHSPLARCKQRLRSLFTAVAATMSRTA